MAKNIAQFNAFYKHYVKALDDKQAALFVGAGFSVNAGLPTWPDLLRDTAAELNLDVDKETDLVALAQFHFNEKKVRTRLNQLIVDEYGKDVSITPNHKLLASLPVETVWTTNYDKLIEKSFLEAGKICDVRITKGNFSSHLRGKDVTVYKMHGDFTAPEDATLTKDDYELYSLKNEIFSNALRGDLVTKTFLFLGFSFTDPNLDYILSRIRLLMGQDAQQHYCIMRWPKKPKSGLRKRAQYDYEMVRIQLRISDLKRYGIEALMIDEFDEITQILETLNKRAHRNNIFVSGSAHTYSLMSQKRLENFAYLLGKEAISRGFNLVSGLGVGIGGKVLIGAVEEVYHKKNGTLTDRIIMRPFPQMPRATSRRKALNTNYRQDMISLVGYSIFLSGNKEHPTTGKTILADGVREEFKISHELGKFIIPVGATGDVSKEIWDIVMADLKEYYPDVNVSKQLQILGDINKTDDEYIQAIFSIIKATSGK